MRIKIYLKHLLRGEAANTNFTDFGLIRLRLEPTIYRTRGEHANYYIADTVQQFGKGVVRG